MEHVEGTYCTRPSGAGRGLVSGNGARLDGRSMEQEFYAHTPAVEGGPWHDLIEHLKCTAGRAEKNAAKFGAGELARLAGLWHDIGKFNSVFQRYLRECEAAKRTGKKAPAKGVPHAPYGARFAREAFPPLMQAIHGHHAGLNETDYVKAGLEEPWLSEAYDEVLDLTRKHLEGFGAPENPAALLSDPPRDELQREFFLRMIFSALVDADFLDTETHFEKENAARRKVSTTPAKMWEVLRRDQAERFARPEILSSETAINRVRAEVYEACVDAAAEPQGVFRLSVPTGGGKTRSGLAFALKHAKEHGLDRAIVAAPYTSIIDQTADVYRGIFKGLGDEVVLEHHSAARQEQPEERATEPVEAEKLHERLVRARLAAQNWEAPLVITTTVQLFESLLANRTSKCRKLHNVAKSVIVLDEVQTLPLGLLKPILSVLRELVRRYEVSVVLCTATQPALDKQSQYLEGFDDVRDIVPKDEAAEHFRSLKRVSYDIREEEWDWEEVARRATEAADSDGAALMVLNSRRDALAVLEAIGDDHPGLFHLSTLLCGAHRRERLAEVRRRLEAKEPCLLVSTQVVEAGVDVSFPVVFRAMGPLDRIVQAAGRCNREDEVPGGGRVVVFRPREGRVPRGEYEKAFDLSEILLRREVNLYVPDVFEDYFRRLYRIGSPDALDAKGIQELRKVLNYPKVADEFRLIDRDTVPVIVEYDEEARQLIKRIRRAGALRRGDHRRLQPYAVGLKKWEFEENEWLTEDLLRESDDVKLWKGTYDPLRGVSAARIDPADLNW